MTAATADYAVSFFLAYSPYVHVVYINFVRFTSLPWDHCTSLWLLYFCTKPQSENLKQTFATMFLFTTYTTD